MATLHIEHAISNFDTWEAAFRQFEEARRTAGVLGHTVQRPDDDPNYVVIDLEFGTTEEAQAFLGFLESVVWAVPANSPALVGSPSAKVIA